MTTHSIQNKNINDKTKNTNDKTISFKTYKIDIFIHFHFSWNVRFPDSLPKQVVRLAEFQCYGDTTMHGFIQIKGMISGHDYQTIRSAARSFLLRHTVYTVYIFVHRHRHTNAHTLTHAPTNTNTHTNKQTNKHTHIL